MIIETITIDSYGQVFEHIVITYENGSTTSMLKSTYEAQQAEQSTPMVADE